MSRPQSVSGCRLRNGNGFRWKTYVFLAFLLLSALTNIPGTKAKTSDTYYVTASSGDAVYYYGGTFSYTENEITVKHPIYDTKTGLRFTSFDITSWTNIENSTLYLYSAGIEDENDYWVTIYGVEGNMPSLTEVGYFEPGNLTLTNEHINVNLKDLEGGSWIAITDLSDIIDEIYDDYGAVTELGLIIQSSSSVGGYRQFTTYDGNTSVAPYITIYYDVTLEFVETYGGYDIYVEETTLLNQLSLAEVGTFDASETELFYMHEQGFYNDDTDTFLFYSNNVTDNELYYYYSSNDGSTWTSTIFGTSTVTDARETGMVAMAKEDGDSELEYVAVYSFNQFPEPVMMRRGTISSNGSITWMAVEQQIWAGQGQSRGVGIGLDDDGYAWYMTSDCCNSKVWAIWKNAVKDGTFSSDYHDYQGSGSWSYTWEHGGLVDIIPGNSSYPDAMYIVGFELDNEEEIMVHEDDTTIIDYKDVSTEINVHSIPYQNGMILMGYCNSSDNYDYYVATYNPFTDTRTNYEVLSGDNNNYFVRLQYSSTYIYYLYEYIDGSLRILKTTWSDIDFDDWEPVNGEASYYEAMDDDADDIIEWNNQKTIEGDHAPNWIKFSNNTVYMLTYDDYFSGDYHLYLNGNEIGVFDTLQDAKDYVDNINNPFYEGLDDWLMLLMGALGYLMIGGGFYMGIAKAQSGDYIGAFTTIILAICIGISLIAGWLYQ